MLSTVLEVAGLVVLVVAGFLLSPVAGLALLGLSLLLVGVLVERTN